MKSKVVWEMVFVGAAVAVGIALSARTWEAYNVQRLKGDEKSTEMKKAEAAREDLLKQKAKLESPAGREQMARDQGFTRPGEKPLENGH